MNRWQALTETVKSFNDTGSPGYALTAVVVIAATFLVPAVVGIVLLWR